MVWHRLTLELGHPSVAVCKESVGSGEFALWCDWFEWIAERPRAERPSAGAGTPAGRKAIPTKTYRGQGEIKGLFMNLAALQQARGRQH